ncbi:hypothetical protein BJ742DRAFT_867507 [Cladochytrium replicatum]|nr:hypothetical protein BJ742DRAFT_867507 [Cladochytrium replicatum]
METKDINDRGFEAFSRRLKNGLFGVLFICNKNSEHHPVLAWLEMLIDHFQDLSFCLLFRTTPWQYEVGWFQSILRIVNPEHLIKDEATLTTVFLVALASLAAVLLNAFWVGYMFSRNNFRFMWTLRLLRATLGLFATILYIPILSVFLRIISACGVDEEAADLISFKQCWSDFYLVRSVGVTLVTIVFILVVTCVTLTFFEPDPKKKSVLSRAHSRVELLYLGCRSVLTALFVFLTHVVHDRPETAWILVAACLCTSLVLFFSYLMYLPYYHFEYNCARAMLMANFVWASLCMLFTSVRPESDVGIIFLIMSPVVMGLSVSITKARRNMITRMPYQKCPSAIVLELKVRFILESEKLLFHRRQPVGDAANKSTYEVELGDSSLMLDESRTEPVLQNVNDIYLYGIRKFQHSCFINLFMGQFHLLQMGNRAQCLASHARGKTLAPRLDEAYLIFRRERLLNERFAGGDVIDFIAFEQNLKIAKKNEKKALINMVQFWGELLRRRPNYRKLHESAAQISVASGMAREKYLAVIKLNPDNAKSYRLYGSFLINILNDKKTGVAMIQHAEELDEVPENQGGDDNFDLLHLMSGECATITMSGNSGSVGKVVDANALVTKVFGYKKTELIGQNINKIIPHPFSEHHDSFLNNYLETGISKFIDRQRHVLGLHKNGFLIMMSLAIKQISTDVGTSFMAFVKILPKSSGEEYIITDENLRMLHQTEGCAEILKLPPGIEDNKQNMTLSNWIPEFELHKEQFMSKDGGRWEIQKNNHPFDVFFAPEELVVAGNLYYLCTLRLISLSNAPSNTSEEEVMKASFGCPMGYGPDSFRKSTLGMMRHSTVFGPEERQISLNFNNADSERDLMCDDVELPSFHRGMMSPDQRRQSSYGESVRTRQASQAQPRQSSLQKQSGHSKFGNDGYQLEEGKERQREPSPMFASPSTLKPLERQASQALSDHTSATGRSGKSSNGHGHVKRIVFKKNAAADRRLNILNIGFILCFIVLTGIGILNHETFRNQLFDILVSYNKAAQIEDAVRAVSKVMECSRTIDLSFDPTLVQLAPNLIDRPRAIEECRINLDQLVQFKHDCGQKILGNYVTLDMLEGTGFVHSVVRTLDVLEAYITAGYVIYNFSISHTTTTAENAPIFRNALQTMLDSRLGLLLAASLNTTGQVSRDEFAQQMKSQGPPFFLQSALGPFMCLLFFIFGRPIYTGIQGARERFISIFLDIPKEVIKGIYESNYQRLVSLNEDSDDEEDEEIEIGLTAEKLDTGDQQDGSTQTSLQGYRTLRGFLGAYFEWSDQYRLNPKWVLIFLLSAAYFLSFGTIVFNWFSNYAASNSFWAQQRGVFAIQVSHSLRTKYFSFLNRTLDRPARPDTIWDTSFAIDRFRILDDALLYGNDDMGVGGVMVQSIVGETILMTTNGCMFSDDRTDYMGENCTTWANGALRRGLHAGVQWFLSTADELNRILTPLSDRNIPLNVTSLEPDIMLRLRQVWMGTIFHFTEPFYYSSLLYDEPLKNTADSIMTVHLITTCVYVTLLAMIYVFLIRPMIRSLHDDSHRFAVMLFMIPPELLSNIKSLVDWAKNRDQLISFDAKKKRAPSGPKSDIEKQIVSERRESKVVSERRESKVAAEEKVRFMDAS